MGKTVFFTRLEYQKLQVGVQHEFILFRGLSKRKESESLNPSSRASLLFASYSSPTKPYWWTTIPEEIYEFVLKFGREASPDSQINALVSTEAYDYVELEEFAHLSKDERNSSIELMIEFPHPIPIEAIIKICASISEHQYAHLYTLRQFNCFFYSWTITTILLRLHVDWNPPLESHPNETIQLLTTRLVELSDPKCVRASPEAQLNPALLIAGEYDYAGFSDASQRPFTRLCHNKIREWSMFRRILDSLQHSACQSSLWVRDDLSVVQAHVRNFLNKIVDTMSGQATGETEELVLDALFWGDDYIQGLPTEWANLISKEVDALLEIYVDKMWHAFNEVLKQTNEANKEKRSVIIKPPLHALQSIGNSHLLLGICLIPVGLLAAWNAARVRASINLPKSPLLPLILILRTIKNVPNEIKNVYGIAGGFIENLALKRNQARKEIYRARVNGAQDQFESTSGFSLNLERSAILGMMTDIDLHRPEFESQVSYEFEKAIKNLALSRPECSMHELRMVTLELMIRLKKVGESINFGLPAKSVWRIILWYSLGEEITKVFEEASQPGPTKRIRCWIRTSKLEARGEGRPMLVSDIQCFIHSRIKDLSEMLHNRGAPGATAHCRKEIEEAMDTIWKGMQKEDMISFA